MLAKFKPRIVAITGSVGKTSTKEAVAIVLASKYDIRKSPKSYNSEFGIPLTVLGLETQWNSVFGWLSVIVRGFFVMFQVKDTERSERKKYPNILVLEAGVDRPGNMDVFLSLIKPEVSVITAIGEIPVHVEFFSGPKELAFEKGKLARSTAQNGCVLLNADDDVVYDMRNEARGKVLTFGFGKGSDVQVSNYAIVAGSKILNEVNVRNEMDREVPLGIRCKVDYNGSTVPLRLEGMLGKQQLYVAAAALGVGVWFGINILDAAATLSALYRPLPGRLRLLEGIKGSLILDDTYNASPTAMHAALDTLHDIPAKRRIAVLGDMLEIGKFTIQAHEAMGELAAPIVNMLCTVGPRAKFIARAAREHGLASEQVHEFGNALEAGKFLDDIIIPGDVVLVKGSQSMRMERTVEEIMLRPEHKKELLVRQEPFWLGNS
ncbi:MAG: UDP-N-acetylmuramoyl-tripeptide--D-alanyl-D-alanine ligase [Parcubacteria group bacterium Gr01-1014_29]|nr:MAG: UDP-N-acetylmuramoyl-tripeptide--D-alanyl-D-alanine ligase [Parcubacteria group bacterium Gr01-1014_29]